MTNATQITIEEMYNKISNTDYNSILEAQKNSMSLTEDLEYLMEIILFFKDLDGSIREVLIETCKNKEITNIEGDKFKTSYVKEKIEDAPTVENIDLLPLTLLETVANMKAIKDRILIDGIPPAGVVLKEKKTKENIRITKIK